MRCISLIFIKLSSTLNEIGRCADDKPFMPTYQVSKEKAKSLGVDFIPLKTGLKETVESLKEKQFVNFWVAVVPSSRPFLYKPMVMK